MKKCFTIVAILIGCIIILILSIQLFNPLRCSEDVIKTKILDCVPLGTDIDNAINLIKENSKWDIINVNYENGYAVDENGKPYMGGSKNIGSQSIRIYLGGYRGLFWIDVIAYLGFDNDAKLIDVCVVKEEDSL